MFISANKKPLLVYNYCGADISVYRDLDQLFFTAMLDDDEYILYELKISDLKRDPILKNDLKNELLSCLAYSVDATAKEMLYFY